MKTSGDRICKTCRYWSELIVRYGGPNRSLEALCLNREGLSRRPALPDLGKRAFGGDR
jgi:hypothetical protein